MLELVRRSRALTWPRARAVLSAGALLLALVLGVGSVASSWAGSHLVSGSGFASTLSGLPHDKAVVAELQDAVQTQVAAQVKPLLALLPGVLQAEATGLIDDAVHAFFVSDAFVSLVRSTISTGHDQLLTLLRGKNPLASFSGRTLTVGVAVTASQLLADAHLPTFLSRLLPKSFTINLTVLQSAALVRARRAIRLHDDLGAGLPVGAVVLALVGLIGVRRRVRGLVLLATGAAVVDLLLALRYSLPSRSTHLLAAAAANEVTAPLAHAFLVAGGVAAAVALAVLAEEFARDPYRVVRTGSGLMRRNARGGSHIDG